MVSRVVPWQRRSGSAGLEVEGQSQRSQGANAEAEAEADNRHPNNLPPAVFKSTLIPLVYPEVRRMVVSDFSGTTRRIGRRHPARRSDGNSLESAALGKADITLSARYALRNSAFDNQFGVDAAADSSGLNRNSSETSDSDS